MITFLRHYLLCWNPSFTFERNIYGDEIFHAGGNRSLWKCDRCGYLKASRELHNV